MFKVAFVVFAFVAVASAVIRPCNRGALGPQPLNHRITGCPDSSRTCRIVRGQDIAGELDFEARSEVSDLRPEITAYAFGVRAVYELPADRNAGCNWLIGTRCPLSTGEFATYRLQMPVIEEYPLTPLEIEVRLFDQNNVLQFCTLVEAEVVLTP